MNTAITTAKAAWNLIVNKAVAIIFCAVLSILYWILSLSNRPVAFAELLYTAILVSAVTVLAPLMRLLVFPEVARYAEGADLSADLADGTFHPRLIHYWFATGLCYLTALVCLASLSH